jgi:hypothetical protein
MQASVLLHPLLPLLQAVMVQVLLATLLLRCSQADKQPTETDQLDAAHAKGSTCLQLRHTAACLAACCRCVVAMARLEWCMVALSGTAG